MFEKLRQSKLLFWSVELLVLATFVFVLTKVDFLLKPLGVFFSTLFAPLPLLIQSTRIFILYAQSSSGIFN